MHLEVKYTPRVWQQFIHSDPHRFKVVLAHRSAGKTYLAMAELIKRAFMEKGVYAYIAPEKEQGKRNLWDRYKEMIADITDNLPGIKINETEKFVKFPNGSVFYVLAADENLRGMHMRYIVLDEVADIKMDLWAGVILPTLTANMGGALIIGTPKKGKNLLNTLLEFGHDPEMAEWSSWVIDVLTSGVYPEDYIATLQAMTPPAEWQQEYMMEEALSRGALYVDMLEAIDRAGQIGLFPYDSRLPVYTGWDLGFNDLTCVWFAQLEVDTNRMYIIDYLEANRQKADYYARELMKKPYLYGTAFLPHDAKQTRADQQSTYEQELNKIGVKCRILPKTNNKREAVAPVQAALHRCFFNKPACEKGLAHLYSFSSKKNSRSGEYTDEVQHNDGADAFRSLIEGLTGRMQTEFNQRKFKAVTQLLAAPKMSPMQASKNKRRNPRP